MQPTCSLHQPIIKLYWIAAGVLLLAGCAGGSPARQIRPGALIISESFDTASDWSLYDKEGLSMRLDAGAYRATLSLKRYAWGQNRQLTDDAIIEVTLQQVSNGRNNGYGILCRAGIQDDGKGYYFLISGDGHFSIRRGDVRSVVPLVEWQYSRFIQQDRGRNTLKAICAGEYLALYVNDQFLAETSDNRYREGFTGLAVVTLEDSIDVRFDHLRVWEAR